ncbi:MAG: hypothetical protein ACRYF5_01230 [Janthinobacterium lividum]
MGFSVSGSLDSILASFKSEFDVLTAEEDKVNSDVDAQYDKYYKQACSGDVSDIPTDALQNMANDTNCSASARETINKELIARGEEPIVSEEENEKLYEGYYDEASDGNTEKIPTSALKNMANDSNYSDSTRDKINEELEARGEEPIVSEEDNEKLYEDYYERASNGDTSKIPTSALQNMASDPNCDEDVLDTINAELESRGEDPIDPDDSDDSDDVY